MSGRRLGAVLVVGIAAVVAAFGTVTAMQKPVAQTANSGLRDILKPGPRPLTEQEQGWVRDARAQYIAQAKNDVDRFVYYLASEYFAFDHQTGAVWTKDDWVRQLRETAARKDTTILDANMPKPDDPLTLRENQMLVVAGTTAIQISKGGAINGKRLDHLLLVWIFRDGRWQLLTDQAVFARN